MSFLYPWFLLGLAALALPLWLHRLERQSAERRPWSSLTFFREAPQESVRRRRYRYFVLLACRLLLLALLAVLFARPFVDAGSALAGSAATRHLVAIDTSHSMAHGETWARAQRAAEAVLAGLRGGDRSQVLAFGPGVRVLGGPTSDHGSWRGAVEALAVTGARASYGELSEAVRTLAADDAAPLHLHLVSDLQRSAVPARFADLALPAGTELEVHDVGAPSRPNWCLESVKGRLRLHGDGPAELHVTLAGFDTAAAVRHVELRVGGRVAGAADVNVPAAGRAVVRFGEIAVPRGYSRAEIRMTPADDLPADDVFFVGLERTDSAPVLFVRTPADARAELYYRTALLSSAAGMFELQAVTPEAAQTLALERFAFVVLYDIARPPALLESRLRGFVEGGRAALVVAGPQVARQKSAPWVTGSMVDSGPRERPLHASAPSAGPMMAGAGERVADVRFHRYLRAEVPDDLVHVRLADGAPLLYEQPLGAGRLLVLTSPFDTRWNDWPLQVSFVPFAAASARWLARLDAAPVPLTVGEVLDLGAGHDRGSSVEVIDPDGRRALGLAESVSGRRVTLARAGFYEIRRPGLTTQAAVNPDVRESDLRPLEAETIARWQATGHAAPAARANADPERSKRDISPRVLWWLVAVVLVESTLANRYRRG